MRSIGTILKEPVFGALERGRQLREDRRIHRKRARLAAGMAAVAAIPVAWRMPGTPHEHLAHRLKKQRTDRYFGRGQGPFERESWMEPGVSACVQLLAKSSESTLCLVRHKVRQQEAMEYKTPKSRAEKCLQDFRTVSYERQEGICHYCGFKTQWYHWTVDHMQPIARGGTDHFNNKVGCCKSCNNAKACLTYDEFLDMDYLITKIDGVLDLSKAERRLKSKIQLIVAAMHPTQSPTS